MNKTPKRATVLGIRQDMTLEKLKLIEDSFIELEHIRRYASVRRFCYGKVLDFACGTGYGSHMIATNDYIEHVIGVDNDPKAIVWAKDEFKRDKVTYVASTGDKIKQKFDTLVCLETIEHIKDTDTVPSLVERCEIDNIIIGFPDKKTKHYNKEHLHDFVKQDVIDLFPNHVVYHVIKSFDSVILLMMRVPSKAPKGIFRNVRDL